MGRVTGSYGRPIHGVSQLPDTSKAVGQCKEQINFYPSIVGGLVKRQGTDHTSKLLDILDEASFVHVYTRSSDETYYIILKPDDSTIYIYDINGVEQVVDHGVHTLYQTMANPNLTCKMHTIADFTFIVNSDFTVLLDDELSTDANNHTAIVTVGFATYGRTYTIYVDDVALTRYTTPDGGTASHSAQIDTSYVAKQLDEGVLPPPLHETGLVVYYDATEDSLVVQVAYAIEEVYLVTKIVGGTTKVVNVTGFNGDLILLQQGGVNGVEVGVVCTVDYLQTSATGVWGDYTISRTVNTLLVKRVDGESFRLSTEDGADGKDLIGISDATANLGDLPHRAPIGYKVRLTNSNRDKADDFWLTSQLSDIVNEPVLWTEDTQSGIKNKFNLDTMPHVLIRDSVDEFGVATFILQHGEWEPRRVGNEDNAPYPAFVNDKITGIGTFQDRLFFVSADVVEMTRSQRFFDFYRFSAKLTRVDDPFRAAANNDKVDRLERFQYLNGDLIFFSEFAQYKLDGDTIVTSENVKLAQVNEYPSSKGVRPIAIGDAIVFATDAGDFSVLKEYKATIDPKIREANDITRHVAFYLPRALTILQASPIVNILFAYTPLNPDTAYVYNWQYEGGELVQAAWHKYQMPGVLRVINIYTLLDVVYLMTQRVEGVFIERAKLQADFPKFGLPYAARLDRRHEVTATSEGFKWRFTPEFELTDDTRLVALKGIGCYPEEIGSQISMEKQPNGDYLTEDILGEGGVGTEVKLVLGVRYDSLYVPPSPYVLDHRGRPTDLERLQVGKLHLNYRETGALEMIIRDTFSGQSRTSTFNGRKMGAPNNIVGFAPFRSGIWSVPVRRKSSNLQIEIKADGFLPFNLSFLEWEGSHNTRSRRY